MSKPYCDHLSSVVVRQNVLKQHLLLNHYMEFHHFWHINHSCRLHTKVTGAKKKNISIQIKKIFLETAIATTHKFVV